MGREAWLQVWGQALWGLGGKERASDQKSENLALRPSHAICWHCQCLHLRNGVIAHVGWGHVERTGAMGLPGPGPKLAEGGWVLSSVS